MVYKWKNITLELAKELWIAREKLAPRERTATGAFAPVDKTWNQYCIDIGSTKSTVNCWLAVWFKGNKSEVLKCRTNARRLRSGPSGGAGSY